MTRSGIWAILSCCLMTLVAVLMPAFTLAQTTREDPIRLKIVGGLADVSQYVRYEEPFWRRRLSEASGGRIQAEIAPFDRSGIRAQEMLALMRLGVVPFGTALLAIVSTEEPEFNAVDLPIVSPDMETLRRTVTAYRPHLEELLAQRYDVELLAVYTYPAQVIFCRNAFRGLTDLAGRRIRTSSVGQSEMFAALGATPVVIPFGETLAAMRSGVVECAVTGTLSANAIGLNEMTTHMHGMAITWGLSVFGANRAAWQSLPEWARTLIRHEVGQLEEEIWKAAEVETGEGIACNAGMPDCRSGRRGTMTIVPVSEADQERRFRLLTETVLPGWVRRCGEPCIEAWNSRLAPIIGVRAEPD
ncbi:TRAP transporter substrate-binding protein [Roseomonas eburnea]|uniref:TRAP transporter substrate-binding protein n=1 Tax=Neoroseomonas eburnea TaxID=1346889 RepID=A0A9X9XGJ5_9PROT|nr:TRAP transporter substrate-binding protein [Neoroseomonas eburnea]MBR0682831.1 TRAP transporter substrate-binding protein [Neoroseomonas eburnea]